MKKIVVIAVLFAVMAGAVYAQTFANLPGSVGGMALYNWESPQSVATLGRIRSAADDFIRPDSYTSARINDWFGMASFSSASAAAIGYAKKLENLYIAAFYGGKFWTDLEQFSYTEGKDASWPGGEKTVKTYTDLTIGNGTNNNTGPSNHIALLIGAADMGFRLSFFSNHQAFSESNIVLDGTPKSYYKNYVTDYGLIVPQLAWSMTKNLTENGIKPYITFNLNFSRDYLKYENASTGGGDNIIRSQNIIQPVFMAGLGGYNLYSKDAFRFSADLEYRLSLNIYDNEYSYIDGGKYKISKIKGLFRYDTDTSNYVITENSSVTNWLRPSFSGQWGSGPVALRLKLDLNMTLTNQEVATMHINGTKLEKNGNEYTSVYFGFNPDIRLAMQWRPISKLALNAGGRINIAAISFTTTEGKAYANGNSGDSYKTVTNAVGVTANQLTLGATFNPADYLTFEAACGIGTNNAISVFDDTAGLFNFTNLLVSLKF